MKRITVLLTTILLLTITSQAQKKKDPRYEHHFKMPTDILTSEYSMDFKVAHSQAEFCKFTVVLNNNTKDFLLLDKGAFSFVFDFGMFKPKSKEIYLRPNQSKRKVTMQVKGSTQFQVENFKVNFDGFSIIPVDGQVDEMENFQVPASKNMIKTDLFKVSLKKSSLKTQETVLVFECIYLGDKIALVDVSKLAIKVDGTDKEYANDLRKSNIKLLRKGEKIKIKAIFHIPGRIADMQFANMTILWKDTFIESEVKKLTGQDFSFTIDRGLTNGKN